jgi:hypothetical protein
MVHSVRPTIGKYTLGERIDLGGPGELYRAHNGRELVAIRVLPMPLTADPHFATRFEREMDRLSALDHPRLIPILAYGQQDGAPYVVTPFEPGEHLRDRFARNRPLPEELLVYLQQLAEALDFSHASGIVHGDLQPSSVLITEDGAQLASIGLAPLCESRGATIDDAVSDPRADIAALARITHHGLTGNLSPTALSGVSAPELPVIRRALAKEYATAGDFVRDLAAAQAGTGDSVAEATANRAARAITRQPTASHPASRLRVPQSIVPQSAAGQRIAALWVAGFFLAMVLIAGVVIALNSRDGGTQANGTAPASGEPAASNAPVSIAPTGGLPYYFPIDNALIARRYAESLALLPAEAADGKLHRVSAECFDPRASEDCLLVFVFYSKQTDFMYNYHYKVRDDAIVGAFVEPALNDDYRLVLNRLPWEKNPNWAALLRESYAQLPAGFAPGGFSAGIFGNAAASNNGVADWTMVYVERGSATQHIFELLGDRVTKLTQ